MASLRKSPAANVHALITVMSIHGGRNAISMARM